MKTLALVAALSPLAALAVTLTFGDPPATDPSGYPIETNDLQKAVVMLQARVCRLEAYLGPIVAERAEREKRRKATEEERAKRAKEDEEHRNVNLEFNRWIADQRRKYGRLTLVGYDTNTCERIYVRMDGVKVRHRVFDDGAVPRRAPLPKKRRAGK